VKSLKLKLRPTKEQKIKLDHWSNCHRFTYNCAIRHFSNIKNTYKTPQALFPRIVVNEKRGKKTINNFFNNKKWLLNCPSAIRKYSVKEAKSNLQSCYTNVRNKNIKQFQLPFKRKRTELIKGYCFSLEKNNIAKNKNKLYIFPKELGEMRYYKTKQLHKLIPSNKPLYDCKLRKTKYNEYYLLIPRPIIKEKPKDINNIVSIDPGIRKFLVTYSPDKKEAYVIGNRAANELHNKLINVDYLISCLALSRDMNHVTKTKKQLKHDLKKTRKNIENKVVELHNQTINFLTKTYNVILLPKLDVKKLVQRNKRQLRTKVVRRLQVLNHCSFFDKLRNKCSERGVKFIKVSEAYTSKTCPMCGTIKKCNETFTCPKCSFTQDRDLVGAMNILLRSVR